jgi:exosortase A
MMVTLPTPWQKPLLLLSLTAVAIVAIFYRDAADMALIWWNSSTFTHCLFIAPLVGWLIWQRKDELLPMQPRPFWPGLALVALGAFAWLVGEAAGAAIIRHAGLVFMLQASVLTILGVQITRGILFPLFYLSFLIPFGEELIPPMQTITAKLCMFFLGLVGIPAHIEGVFITTPTGLFEVAEACSGVKFLVAMFAYATLAANVCFRSWLRRAVFMAVAVIVPVIANGIRAYSTIHVSYASGNTEFAGSIDHVIYGWFFFGFVMVLVMGLSWKFFDRKIADPWLDDGLKAIRARPAFSWATGVAIAALALVPVGWSTALAHWNEQPMARAVTMPQVPGWTQTRIIQKTAWQPRFDGADHMLFGQYVNAQGQRIDLSISIYSWQAEGRELVGFAQGSFDPGTSWSWTNDTPAPANGKGERLFAPGVAREVLSFYRLGGVMTGNENRVKIETLKRRLVGGDQAAVAILVSAEDRKEAPARPMIEAFLRALGPVEVLADRKVAEARGR